LDDNIKMLCTPVVNPEKALEFLTLHPRVLKKKYYEYLVLEAKMSDEKYHTELIKHYIDAVEMLKLPFQLNKSGLNMHLTFKITP